MDKYSDYIICPKCKAKPAVKENLSGFFCNNCNFDIKFINGIYFTGMSGDMDASKKTIGEFGKRWNLVYKKLGGLKDFLFPMIEPVQKDFFKDKVILDAGGGFGRLTKILLDSGARHVFLLDASTSVYAALDYLKDYSDRVTLIQGDLLNPPFAEGKLDIVFCHGVLHHTGDGKRGIIELSRLLKADSGSMILWVYAKEGNEFLSKLLNLIRNVSLRAGNWGRWRIADLIDLFLLLLVKLVYGPLDKIFKIKKKLWYGEYFIDFLFKTEINNRMDRLQMYHDFLTTNIVTYYSKPELENWFKNDAGYKKIEFFFYRKQSWSVSASFNAKEDFSGIK